MGQTVTPTYRVEYHDQTGKRICTWHGRATIQRLADWIHAGIESHKVGGCNLHISEMLGFIPVPHKAVIVRQSTGEVVVSWKAPMFMVI